MNELKKLSDNELIQQLKCVIQKERAITIEVIHHLREVEVRKLFLSLGFPSLFEYAVKELGYSESAAYRRISAMRVVKEMPQIEEAIQDGKLTLSKVAQAEVYFRKEARNRIPLPVTQKFEIFEQMKERSSRQCELLLAEKFPLSVQQEKVRVVSSDQVEVKFVASKELIEKLIRFKDLNSHVQVAPSYAELIEELVDFALKHKDPLIKRTKTKALPTSEVSLKSKNDGTVKVEINIGQNLKQNQLLLDQRRSRLISSTLRQEIWRRDGGKCVYRNGLAQKECGSRFQLQIDHIQPFGKAGLSVAENLRLVCRQHNLYLARQQYGESKMMKFQRASVR